MKNLKPNLSKGEQKVMEEPAKKKRYYYNQCRQMPCCRNNGGRKIHEISQPPAT